MNKHTCHVLAVIQEFPPQLAVNEMNTTAEQHKTTQFFGSILSSVYVTWGYEWVFRKTELKMNYILEFL